MLASDNDKQNLYDNLLRQGVSKDEIKKLHQSLREKGYGAEEARRRSQIALERLRAQRAEEERRTAALAHKRSAPTLPGETAILGPSEIEDHDVRDENGAADKRRAVDWIPDVSPRLRRHINRWAFRNGFLITRLPERFDDFLSLFDKTRKDYVNRGLLKLLAFQRGYKGMSPYELSLIDDLDALRDSARRLLGAGPLHGIRALERDRAERRGQEVRSSLRIREPFALEFFGVFVDEHVMLRRTLEYLDIALKSGKRVEVAELARVIKEGLRLIVCTEAIESDKLDSLFDIALDVNLSVDKSPASAEDLLEAEGTFRAGFQNLRRYSHELYPALLKMIGAFYEEYDESAEKVDKILAFLDLREDQILSWEGWQKRLREEREKALQEQQAREVARLEQEKAEKLSFRFEGSLAMLSALFPDSGIERIEQGEFVLPYFANRVFTRAPLFQSRSADIEHLPASDVMGLILVVHSILDDLLASVEPYAMEKLLGAEGFANRVIELREEWHDAYPRLFSHYLDQVRDWAREMEGDPRYIKMFREGRNARSIEERANQLRNRAIRNFGHIISEREHYDGPKLFELAERLRQLLADAGEVINQSTLAADDPVRRKLAEDMRYTRIVDLVARSQMGTAEFRAVTRQIRRYIEARFRTGILDIPQKSQVAFLDAFRGIAELYSFLLNDPKSLAAHASHFMALASDDERGRWAREKNLRPRETFESLQATLKEEFPGQFVDALTGLKNKEWFLTELKKQVEKLKAQNKPLTMLMIDIDHFKLVNDELGHPRGDQILKATADMVLDNIREGDVAVRFGGEEILIVIPSELHTGIILAERLRYAQEQYIQRREAMADVKTVGELHAQPCGSLSIGVSESTGSTNIAKAVERVDKALYAAKRTRNSVVFVDPAKEKAGGEPFTSYAEYRAKARSATA